MKAVVFAVLLMACGSTFAQTPVAAVELTVDMVGLNLREAPVDSTLEACLTEQVLGLGDVELVPMAARAEPFDESARLHLHVEGFAIRSGYLAVYRIMHSGGLFRGSDFEWVTIYSSFVLAPADNPAYMCESVVRKLESEALAALRETD